MKNLKFHLVILILAALYSAVSAEEEERRVKAIAAARPSVVSIRTYKESGGDPGIGSGVIIRSNGLILTNHHVIRDADVIKVTTVDEKITRPRYCTWLHSTTSRLSRSTETVSGRLVSVRRRP